MINSENSRPVIIPDLHKPLRDFYQFYFARSRRLAPHIMQIGIIFGAISDIFNIGGPPYPALCMPVLFEKAHNPRILRDTNASVALRARAHKLDPLG